MLKSLLRRAAITGGLEASHVLKKLGAFAGARGRGAIFTLHHVRPFSPQVADINRHLEITPDFLEAAILQLKADGYRFVPLDEIPALLQQPDGGQPVAAFTLDDGYRDNAQHGLPVFARHGVPFTVFVCKGFSERSHTIWWETLDALVNACDGLDFDCGAGDVHFPLRNEAEKYAAGLTIGAAISREENEAQAIEHLNAVAAAKGIDAAAIADRLVMKRDELKALAAHPLASLGAHTISHRALAFLSDADAAVELNASADYVEGITGSRPAAFAYPYGDSRSVTPRTAQIAAECGFKVAVTTRPGTLGESWRDRLTALPRISLNGHFQTRRHVSALASGIPFRLGRTG